MAEISVVIPAYNAEYTIGETIESILNQDCNVQAVVVDDGSTDATSARCREFGSRITLIQQPNQGVSAARNRGLPEAESEWVVFVDADDLLAPQSLHRRLRIALSDEADAVVSCYAEFEDVPDIIAGKVKSRVPDWAKLETLGADVACATNFWVPPVAVLYRKAVVQAVGGFRSNLKVLQDARLLFDVAQAGPKFSRDDRLGGFYRVSPGGLSRSNPERFWIEVLINGEEIEQVWRDQGPLSNAHIAALHGIYDGAAAALFRCKSFEFPNALDRIEKLGLRPSRKVLAMKTFSKALGLQAATHLYNAYRILRASSNLLSASVASER